MDEVAHVCNDYWPTARQLWKPAVVVVELGVTDCKYPLYRWISYTCNKSIQLSSCTAPRLGNPSRGRNDLIDVHLSNQELKDVHPAVEGNPSRGRNDLIDVHLSNQELKDVHPAVEANPSLRRNDLIDVHLSNQELKDVHPAVETNDSVCPSPPRDRLATYSVRAVKRNGGCIFFAQGHCPFGIDCWFSHLGSERSCIGEASTSRSGYWFSNELGLPGISPPPGNEHEPPWNNHERAAVVRNSANPSIGRNSLIDVHLSNQDLKDVHHVVEANPSLGRNNLIDVHLSNEDLKDVHPAVETNDSVCPSPPRDRFATYSVGAVKRNGGCIFFAQGHCPFGIDCWFSHLGGERSCIGEASTSRLGRYVQLSNQDLKDVHLAVEVNPSLGIKNLIDVHLSNQDPKDVHPAVETNDSVCPSPLRDRLAADSVGAVKRNGGCIFFAQGHCPFGIDCWFSHLGSERSCIGEASTSRSGYWFSNELGLPGISPPTGNDDEPPGNDDEPPGNNSERAAVIRNIVCELENQSLLPDLVRELFGSAVYRSCCKEGTPRGISCWFQPEVQSLPIFNNQFLSWRSPKRSNSPWEDGVTRVDRRWVQLTVEEKNIVGPIRSKQEEDIVGLVRDQKVHLLCWAYVAVDLVSAMRLINGQDDTFVPLSVRELCFYARPGERFLRTVQKIGHRCHELRVEFAFDYIMSTGVRRQGGNEETFDCVEGGPGEGEDTVRIEDYTFLGRDFKAALKRLQLQPIGASLHVFEEYWDIKKGDIYRGPTSNNTKYYGLHAVVVVDAFFIDGELIFWCKSSSGKQLHDEGYIMVSAAIMVLGLHYESDNDEPTFGIRDQRRSKTALYEPAYLISDFVYPRMKAKSKKGKRKRSD
ncbi:unnamed protein product [Brassica oleracea]